MSDPANPTLSEALDALGLTKRTVGRHDQAFELINSEGEVLYRGTFLAARQWIHRKVLTMSVPDIQRIRNLDYAGA